MDKIIAQKSIDYLSVAAITIESGAQERYFSWFV